MRGQRLALGEQRADVLALALRHAHLLGVGIAGRARLVGRDLRGLAALLEGAEARDVEHEAAAREVAATASGSVRRSLVSSMADNLGSGAESRNCS